MKTIPFILLCVPIVCAGCFSLCIGYPGQEGVDGVLTQHGKVQCITGQPETVFYPVPYASPPNLEIDQDKKSWTILEQRTDAFCITRTMDGPALQWTARGSRAPRVAPPQPAAQTPPAQTLPEPAPMPAYPLAQRND